MLEQPRSTQSKPARGAVRVFFHGTNTQDNTVTFSINGQRWEYWLHRQDLDSIEYIAKRWVKKGLAHAKRRAIRTEKLA